MSPSSGSLSRRQAPASGRDAGDGATQTPVVGRIGAPHGIRGWCRVQSFTDPQDNLFSYAPWLIDWPGRGVVSIAPEEWRRAQGRWTVKLPGVADRDAAAALSSLDIRVDAGVFASPEDDEYFWHELVGMSVTNREGIVLGRVVRLLETGAHDVLSIQGPAGDHLIPFVAEFVDAVDRTSRAITVDWQADW